ncbi:MAG: hypothetical protein Q9214_000495 [Letrouitia sp. 1 TL-2023]
MRTRLYQIAILASLEVLLGSSIVEGRYNVRPRQDSRPPGPSPTAVPSPDFQSHSRAPSPVKRPLQSSSEETLRSVKHEPTKSLQLEAAAATSLSAATEDTFSTSSSSADPAILTAAPIANGSLPSTGNTTHGDLTVLPVRPVITPALSVAGAFMMLTGVLYTLIGIKTKWLHIFFSTAYLTSLAVSVLIIYVMHPPISNAIQGAYFVAAFVTGMIFGGGSVIFTDVTEGLGCLLGGFCLSMWFLVLTPGGLITSTAGKAIFISCFTLGIFGFYISHWTRAYGLIGATSFAGATVIVLGIDCFSRAGLKEFWLYIWDLNADIFPLHYDGPYPITRGIRVEIAAIIIIFLLGVMSQMKVWKIIKKRREERAAERLRQEQLQDQAEEDLGRKLEEGNEQERNVWETAYGGRDGDRKHIDSGIGTEVPSVKNRSFSFEGSALGSQVGSIEMDNLDRPKASDGNSTKGKGRATVTVRIASDDEISLQTRLPTDEEHITTANHPSQSLGDGSIPSSPATVAAQSSVAADDHSEGKQKTKNPKSLTKTLGPKITPLPFEIPPPDNDCDRHSSIAASVASENVSARPTKKIPGSSLMHNLSKRSQRSFVATSTSEEALMVPHIDDDQESSIAATMDEVSDGHRSEADTSTLADALSAGGNRAASLKFSPPTEPHPMDRPNHKISEMSLGQKLSQGSPIENSEPEVQDSLTRASPVISEHQDSPAKNRANPTTTTAQTNEEHLKDTSLTEKLDSNPPANSATAVSSEEKKTARKSLAEQLPEKTSKVVMAFRTNEWAKHLDQAEKPSLDDLKAPQKQRQEVPEQAAPLNVAALQQTPLNAEPAPVAIEPPQLSTTQDPSKPAEFLATSPQQSRTNLLGKKSLENSMTRSPSQTSLDSVPSPRDGSKALLRRGSSQTSLAPNRGYRSSSTPLASPLVESPIEEGVPSTFPQRYIPSPLLPDNLMSQRQNMMQNRPSSTSLNRNVSHTSSTSLQSAETDNMSLSARKSLIQLQQQQQLQRQSSQPLLSSPSNSYPYPVTHPPLPHQQNSDNNSSTTIAAWRASLQPSVTAKYQDRDMNARRSELLSEKRRSEANARHAEIRRSQKDRQADGKMRRGEMEDRHREAMRKMQGEVKS